MFKIIQVFLFCLFLQGCNTMHGVGRDMQDAGNAIQYGVSDIRDSLKI